MTKLVKNTKKQKFLYAIVFILAVVVIGGVIGSNLVPGAWYQALHKPFFTPPNWLFAPVWFVLYVIIGFVGWRIFIDRPNHVLQLIWIMQLVLNFTWTPLFFGFNYVFLALIVCLCILILVLVFIGKAFCSDRLVSLLFIPYAIWLCVANALNGGIWFLN